MQTKLNLVKGITQEALPDLAIESGEGIVALDQKGCVISVNSEAEKILGWCIDDIKGKDFSLTVIFHFKMFLLVLQTAFPQ